MTASKPSMERVALDNSASRQAVTRVNAEQASKTHDVDADLPAIQGRPPSWEPSPPGPIRAERPGPTSPPG